MPGPINPTEMDAAKASASSFRGTALRLAGNDAPGAAESSVVGAGFPVVPVGLDQLTRDVPGGDPAGLVEGEATHVLFPIQQGDRLVGASNTQKRDDAWTSINGNLPWLEVLMRVRSAHSRQNKIPEEEYHLFDARALGLYFLAVPVAGRLKLVPTLDDPTLGFRAGDTLEVPAVMEILKKLARSHNSQPT